MNWDEDHLLGRMPDARGHNAKRMAPGGFIVSSFDQEGKNIELSCNRVLETCTTSRSIVRANCSAYDADMEWDIGTPWYRPTRDQSCDQRRRFWLAKWNRQVARVLS